MMNLRFADMEVLGMKEVVFTEKAPAPIGPYSQAVMAEGRFLFVSGQIPIDPETGQLVEGPIEEQAKRAIENLLAIVEAAGGSADSIVKVTVYKGTWGSTRGSMRSTRGISPSQSRQGPSSRYRTFPRESALRLRP